MCKDFPSRWNYLLQFIFCFPPPTVVNLGNTICYFSVKTENFMTNTWIIDTSTISYIFIFCAMTAPIIPSLMGFNMYEKMANNQYNII